MAKKKLLLDLILKQSNKNDEDSDGDNDLIGDGEGDSDSDGDSDAELQRAFAAGELKPGLHGLVAFKRTENQINDKEGLKRKFQEIKIYQDNWIERLDIVSKPAEVSLALKQQHGDLELKLNRRGEVSGEELNEDKAQHDFKREMLFYRQAQASVMEAIKLLQTKYGIKQTRRPDDYFAEMAKSDDHMKNVRERLQSKQTSIEESEKVKKLRDLKKYGKKVQREVQLKRQQDKKDLLQKIQNYKKGKEESLDFLDDEYDNESHKKKNSTNQAQGNSKPKVTKRQKYKEAKYGYGGQKKRSKNNTSDSAASMDQFSARKHGRPVAKKKGNQRMGKSRRQKSKSK